MIKVRSLGGLFLSLAFASLGCAPTDEEPAPDSTAVGTLMPGATTTTAMIGTAGGTVQSADGRVTVRIPAGALSGDAPISVAPISNEAHGGIGTAYRMTGAETFQQPVSLVFSWTDDEVANTAPEFLDVAFQNADGFWQLAETVTVDAAAKTITATTMHFTDWSFVARFRITPASARLKVNGGQMFQIERSFPIFGERPRPGDDRQLLGFNWFPINVTYGALIASDWTVNGIAGGNSTIGTFHADVERGGYAAPEKKPSPDTVTVSVRVTSVVNKKETGLLKARVTITEEGERIDVTARYSKQGQNLTSFVTGNVTDNGFQFQMSFPVVDEQLMVVDTAGGSASALADTRAGCIMPTVDGPWDELTATSASITGSFFSVEGTALTPPITLGVGEGDCSVDRRTEPATTRSAGVQMTLPIELFTSASPPETPLTVTQDGWTFTYTTVR